ncbi:MAG: HEAT repeat domain-containing protein, partial [Terriglobales bacterium]
MVGPTVDAALAGSESDPQKSHQALATVLQNLQPDLVLSAFPAERHESLRGMSSEQIASELMEDRAVEWAANRLRTAPAADSSLVVEEDVLRVLARGIKATQGAERMLDKLAHYVEKYALPPSILERIKAEVEWNSLPPKEQMARLLTLRHFGPPEFRHLMELVKEFLQRSYPAEATALALHYLGVTELPVAELQPETLSRIPVLLRAMAGVRTEFAQASAEKLGKALLRDDFTPLLHQQTRNALITLANAIAAYEDFPVIQSIGVVLERSLARNPAQHAECCGEGLKKLLPASSLERMVELLAQKREDAAWVKTAAVLFRWTGEAGVEKVFQRLEEEKTAGNRMALMRFIAQTGHAGLDVARKRLSDERWYVVRNACQVLGELKDPELLRELALALRHSDDRVQKAAVDVIIKGRDRARAKVFAEALPHLRAHTLEHVLDELFFLKTPATLYALQEFIFHDSRAKTKVLEKAVHAVTAIPG